MPGGANSGKRNGKVLFAVAVALLGGIILLLWAIKTEELSPCPEGMNSTNEGSYSVVMQKYLEGAISVEYPQIEYPLSPDLEEQMNQKLRETFLSLYQDHFDWDALSVDASCQVMLNREDCMSFLCESTACASMSHPVNFCFGVTVDMQTGTFVSLENYLDIEEFRDIISKDGYTVTPDYMKDKLFVDDQTDLQYCSVIYDDADNLYTYYITPGSICILMNIPHAYGDIATIHIPMTGD